MTTIRMLLSLAAMALLAGSSAMAMDTSKGFFIPIVPVPNSTLTNVFGINDSDVITGSWLDASGVEHGYVGPLDGTNYTTFDDPKSPAPGTEPRAINNNGYITGFSNSQNGSTGADIPFERDPRGAITEITKGGALLNYLVQGINSKGNEFAGGYVNSALQVVGYLGADGKFLKKFKVTGLENTGYAGRAVNNSGDIVGWYYDPGGVQHGLLVSGGKAQKLDPNETTMSANVLEGINDKGIITGFWTDTTGLIHGYFYSMKKMKFVPINVQGSMSFVQPWGVSDTGLIAVGSDAGYFIYCPPRVTCPGIAHGSHKPLAKPKPQLP
jgi:hypothetical protein